VREEVESLLRSYEVAGSFMESPAVAQAADDLAAEQKLTPGQRIKHYQIVNLIGEGGMGEVYLANDTTLGRRVALKVLPTFVSKDPERLRRFTQEARAASRLSHPNVCVVHEVGETEDGRPFIAMEYVEGMTLRQKHQKPGNETRRRARHRDSNCRRPDSGTRSGHRSSRYQTREHRDPSRRLREDPRLRTRQTD
jgi:serine/threonine protein kinase